MCQFFGADVKGILIFGLANAKPNLKFLNGKTLEIWIFYETPSPTRHKHVDFPIYRFESLAKPPGRDCGQSPETFCRHYCSMISLQRI